MRHGWSLSPRSWAAMREAFENRPWKQVPFRIHSRALVPNACGVYVLAAGSGVRHAGVLARLYGALYVGQSVDLRARFLQHLARPQPELERAVRSFALDFWFTPSDEPDLLRLEALLIECLGPSANRLSGIRAAIGEPVSI